MSYSRGCTEDSIYPTGAASAGGACFGAVPAVPQSAAARRTPGWSHTSRARRSAPGVLGRQGWPEASRLCLLPLVIGHPRQQSCACFDATMHARHRLRHAARPGRLEPAGDERQVCFQSPAGQPTARFRVPLAADRSLVDGISDGGSDLGRSQPSASRSSTPSGWANAPVIGVIAGVAFGALMAPFLRESDTDRVLPPAFLP